MKEKTYAKGIYIKEIKQDFFGISVKVETFIEFLKEHINGKGYVNLNMSKRKESGKYGDTHYVTLNDYKKEDVPKPPPLPEIPEEDNSQLPF